MKRMCISATFQVALLLQLVLLSSASWADVNSFLSGMVYSGTAPFDSNDANATNSDVRTHDDAAYRAAFSLSSSDTGAVITYGMGSFTLPATLVSGVTPPTSVAFFDPLKLPTGSSGCQNISQSPVANPAPAGTSGVTADGQTVFCSLPSPIGGVTLDIPFTVLGDTPNGTILNAPTVTFRSDNNPATSTPTESNNGSTTFGLAPLTLTSSPQWDLTKDSLRGSLFIPKSGPAGEDGFVSGFNIAIHATGSRKGLEALNTAYFTENYNDPEFPNAKLVNWNIDSPGFAKVLNTDPNACAGWQTKQAAVGNYFDNGYHFPRDFNNGNTSTSVVANGGSCVAQTINNTLQTAIIDLLGVDWSLSSYPTKKGTNSAAKTLVNPTNPDDPTNEWWVGSKSILIWIPMGDVPADGVTRLLTNKAYLFGSSITGQANIEPVLTDADNTENSGVINTVAGSMNIRYVPLQSNNPLGLDLAPRDPNVTSSAHVNQVSPGQVMDTQFATYNTGTMSFGAGMFCDRIDNSRLTYLNRTPAFAAYSPTRSGTTLDPDTGVITRVYSGDMSDLANLNFQLGVSGAGASNGGWNSFSGVTSEYVYPATSGSANADNGCDDGDATWFDSITALEGAGYSLQDINRVRATYDSFTAGATYIHYLPLQARSTFAYSGSDNAAGTFAAGDSTLDTYSTNVALWKRNDGLNELESGDAALIFNNEFIEISKSSPTHPDGSLVSPGSQVGYQLQVNATTSGTAHNADITVWDVLPNHLTYQPSSSQLGGVTVADPACTTSGLPTDIFPQGTVPAGHSACKWVLANQAITKVSPGTAPGDLPVLSFAATVSLSANSNDQLLNTSFADSTNNAALKAFYDGAGRGFVCKPRENCSFSNWLLTVSANPGIVLNKSVNQTLVSADTGFNYTLNYGVIGNSLPNVRLLEILPHSGDPRGSNYSGSFSITGPVTLNSVDTTASTLYTNNVSANINVDPYDSGHNLSGSGSNSATTSNWCTAGQFGIANCPANFAEATGIMIRPFFGSPQACGSYGSVPCLTPGNMYNVSFGVIASGNKHTDVYQNNFIGDSPGLLARAPGSNTVSTQVIKPDLVISKTVSPGVVNAGETATYIITPKNNTGAGVGPVDNVPGTVITITDNLPTGIMISNASDVDGGTNWDCSASVAPSTVSCEYDNSGLPIGVGGAVGNPITVSTTAGSLSSDTDIDNTASIQMTGQAEISTNNTATATVTVKPTPSNTPQSCSSGVGGFADWSNSGGTGTFSSSGINLPVLPNFSFVVTGDDNGTSVDSSETFTGINQFEAIYGQADSEENLNVKVEKNVGSVGSPIDRSTQLNITFDSNTPSSGWAFLMHDFDEDQATISAKDANGNPVSNAVINSWFIELFDPNPSTDGTTLAVWDSPNATVVGAGNSGVNTRSNTIRSFNSDNDTEAPGIWFQPNISLSELNIQFESVARESASYHIYLASCLELPITKDFSDAPADGSATPNGAVGASDYGVASHTIVSGIQLGATVTAEASAIEGADNASDDGVSLPTLTEGDTSYSIPAGSLTGSGIGNLHAWIDFNGDGAFGATEYATVGFSNGASGSLNFTGFGTTMNAGTTYARFRLTNDTLTSADFVTAASDGEVEDYQVTIVAASTANIGTAGACAGNWHKLVDWTTAIPAKGSTVDYSANGNIVTVEVTGPAWAEISDDNPAYASSFGGGPIAEPGLVELAFTFSQAVAQLRFVHTDLDNDEGGIITAAAGTTVAVTDNTIPSASNPLYKDSPTSGQVRYERGNAGPADQADLLNAAMVSIKSPVTGFVLSSTNRNIVATTHGGGTQGLTHLQICADFTDAPTSYGDTYHSLRDAPTIYLGSTAPTGDTDPYDNATAAGDDDNGVTLPTSISAGSSYDVTVVSTGGGLIQGWIDWNKDGDFADANEQIITDGSGGTVTLTAPAGAVAGTTFARFRTASTSVNAIDAASDGEVEDYQVTIVSPPPNFGSCPANLYLSQAPNANTNVTLYNINQTVNPFTYPAIGQGSTGYNGIGFNQSDNYIYGIANSTVTGMGTELVRIGSDGTTQIIGNVIGLPMALYKAGDFSPAGDLYVFSRNANPDTLYRVDISTLTATPITMSQSINVADFTYFGGLLYGVNILNGQLISINPSTGAVIDIGATGTSTFSFGAMHSTTNGVYGNANNGSGFYKLNTTTGEATLISSSPSASVNDGASCGAANITFAADIEVTKDDGNTQYTPGANVTYTVTATNNGPFGASGVTISDPLPTGITTASWTCVEAGGANCTASGSGAINDVIDLPNGATATYTVIMTVPLGFTGDLINVATATVGAGTSDPTLGNNSATDTNTLTPPSWPSPPVTGPSDAGECVLTHHTNPGVSADANSFYTITDHTNPSTLLKIGPWGVASGTVEGLTADVANGVFYALNANRSGTLVLGELDFSTGSFSDITNAGSATISHSVYGTLPIFQARAIAHRPGSSEVWIASYNEQPANSPGGSYVYLFKMNTTTGAVVTGAFAGEDYIAIDLSPYDLDETGSRSTVEALTFYKNEPNILYGVLSTDRTAGSPKAGHLFAVDLSQASPQAVLAPNNLSGVAYSPGDSIPTSAYHDIEGMAFDDNGDLIIVSSNTGGANANTLSYLVPDRNHLNTRPIAG